MLPTIHVPLIIATLARATYAVLIEYHAKKLGISLDQHILEALLNQSPIVAGASGGKDSACMIILLAKFLTAIGYTGERLICHADLGEIEHVESIDEVRRLASFVGWNLKIVQREKGGPRLCMIVTLNYFHNDKHNYFVKHADQQHQRLTIRNFNPGHSSPYQPNQHSLFINAERVASGEQLMEI